MHEEDNILKDRRKAPLISIVIPCRNEKEFIGGLLENILNQDYPKDNLEVFVIDGMSDDGTRDIVKEYELRYSFIRLLDNTEKVVPHALNKGINISRGDFIIRMDSHASYPEDYISKLLYWQKRLNADNIGGVWITRPFSNSIKAQAIAFALSNKFGVGDAYFRVGVDEPKEVDTVPFGCYKREVFNKIGLFDEDLVRNQDDELNARLKKRGGKIFLVPDIEIIYYARDKIKKLWIMYFQYGYFKPLVNIKVGSPVNLRQFMPFFFISSLVISLIIAIFYLPIIWLFIFILGSYCILNILVSLTIAFRNNKKLFFSVCISFAAIHFSYGIGYIKGVVDFILLKRHKRRDLQQIKLSR